MKNRANILFFVTLSFLFMACSATNRLTMGVTTPAQIPLDSEVVKIGIINRSVASEKNKTIDKIDKIVSLEGLHLDKEGAENVILGLQQELERGNRFKLIQRIEGHPQFEKGLGVFPAAISWEIVEQICRENDVDVLFALEFYDTDTAVDYEVAMVRIPNNLGIKAVVPGHRLKLNTIIKNGWRVYDPIGHSIVDEYVSNDHVVSIGEGINPIKALEAIIGRKEAVMGMSSNLGINYGRFTKPERIRVARDYFVRGTDNFKIAKRRAQTGNWDSAAELWSVELNNRKSKIAGRAYYNMAISYEINGNLDRAIEFASISYSDYGNSNALRYVNVLRNRIVEKQVLENQLSKLDFNE
jgi:hypothetical protein